MWDPGKWYSVASIFFGIIAIPSSVIFFIGFPAAVLAIFFGLMAVKRYYRKSGTTSIIMGIISIVITVVVFVNVVSALNVTSLISGKWTINGKQYAVFDDDSVYIWYNNKDNREDDYYIGEYKLSSGIYKGKKNYVMGYTITLTQHSYITNSKNEKEPSVKKYLIYQDDKQGQEKQSDVYEIMNMQTGQINTAVKEKNDLWWWIF